MTAVDVGREPTDQEIESVLNAFDLISRFINAKDGTINASGMHDIYTTLRRLSDYELWLGACNLEEALFGSESMVNPIQATLFEIFKISCEQGVEAL